MEFSVLVLAVVAAIGFFAGYFSRPVLYGLVSILAVYALFTFFLTEEMRWATLNLEWATIRDSLDRGLQYLFDNAGRIETLAFFPAFYLGVKNGLLKRRPANGNHRPLEPGYGL